MLNFVQGDILDSDCEVLVDAVNCVGVAGKGVALAFKRRFPRLHSHYLSICEYGLIQPGIPKWHLNMDSSSPTWIVLFPTKNHWRDPSKLEWIDKGLRRLAEDLLEEGELGISSIALPALGCGAGGLDWEREVKPLMLTHLGSLNLRIDIHEPQTA